jgi:hypothetical protein
MSLHRKETDSSTLIYYSSPDLQEALIELLKENENFIFIPPTDPSCQNGCVGFKKTKVLE